MGVYTRRITSRVTAVAAGADQEFVVAEAPLTGVYSVYYIPDTVLTGANTDSRTLQAFNRGAAGAGTTKSHEKAYTSGVDAAALDKNTVTVVTAGTTNVCTKDDVITFKSLHVGSTGLAMPPGLVVVEFTTA